MTGQLILSESGRNTFCDCFIPWGIAETRQKAVLPDWQFIASCYTRKCKYSYNT